MLINNKEIRLIQVKGDYYIRGLQYGKLCREEIGENIKLCISLCKHYRNVDTDIIYSNAERFVPALRKYDPDILLEMKGIAEGAGVTLLDIVLLNVRSELMNQLWGINLLHEGCSTFAFKSDDSKKLFIAQTWDWLKFSADRMIILVEKDDGNNTFMTITEAGIVGNVGINNKGVGVFLNYISVMENSYAGASYHVLLRRALESNGYYEVQRELCRAPISFAIHIMSCDQSKHLTSYEVTSTGIDFKTINEKYILHTNHIISDKLKCKKIMDKQYLESEKRYKMLDKHLMKISNLDGVTLSDIYESLKLHDNDNSICKHFFTEDEYEFGTIFSFVVEYSEEGHFNAYLSFGEPCKNALQKIIIDELMNF